MTLKRPPIAISGLVLGLFGTAHLLLAYHSFLFHLFYIIGFVLWLYLSLALLFAWKSYQGDLGKAPLLSAFATYPMASMLLAAYLTRLIPTGRLVSQGLWYLALGLHLFLIVYFSWAHIITSSTVSLTPSWTVLYVGISMVALTNSVVNQPFLGYLSLVFGCLASIILYPLLFINRRKPLNDGLFPQYAIYCAPFSLLLGGYIRLAGGETNKIVVLLCLVLSQFFYIFVIYLLPSILKRGFQVSSSALTFPVVNTAFAFRLGLAELGLDSLLWIAHLEAVIALVLVSYVFLGYQRYVFERKVI